MPAIAMTDVATNSLSQINLFVPDRTRWVDLMAHMQQFEFDLHEIRLPSAQQKPRFGAVYATEDEMRYGPRHVDQDGLERVRAVFADLTALHAPPVTLK